MEDKETALEMKKKLDGRLPSMDAPICIEISLKTPEVCNVWANMQYRYCVCEENNGSYKCGNIEYIFLKFQVKVISLQILIMVFRVSVTSYEL